jgi:hypothetical protein
MPARPASRRRFNDGFHKTLPRGPAALIGWLGLAALILIVIAKH